MSRTALITGISGQDGAYLAKALLDKGYRVVGGMRRSSSGAAPRLEELRIAREVALVDIEMAELTNIMRVLERVRPVEIYNLAAQSFVALSFEQPVYTSEVCGIGALRILEAVHKLAPATRFYQASTSEMYGRAVVAPQDEATPFHPRSPYGAAKQFAHAMTVNYRDAHGMHACSGIRFNHESPLRGREFVTRKITLSLARIRYGELDVLELGNLEARRDWDFAGDYVDAMWRMLQQDEAADFVIATGRSHTVRSFVEAAAARFRFALEWAGSGVDECGIDRRSGRVVVRVNPALYRPAEIDALVGSPEKAERVLGWRRSVEFEDLVTMMAEADDRRVRDNALRV